MGRRATAMSAIRSIPGSAGSVGRRCVYLSCAAQQHQGVSVSLRRSHSVEYRRHLASPEWRAIRKAALVRAGYRCAFCGLTLKQLRLRGRHLEVHHNNYGSLGHERPEDLTVLCAGRGGCHSAADRQRRLAAGRRPKAKRKRSRRRLSKPLREVRTVVLVLVGFPVGLKLAAILLPYAS
jgi:5-methylcytosine-specific restriction endonuclease McrA